VHKPRVHYEEVHSTGHWGHTYSWRKGRWAIGPWQPGIVHFITSPSFYVNNILALSHKRERKCTRSFATHSQQDEAGLPCVHGGIPART
jgi:hypothetical protein